jgi:dTDP-4-amino-4,6-dideoxygalactose transaminase
MALQAAGVKSGDEVISVPFTFIATANTILMQGAKPVFVDIEPETFNIDVSRVEAAITPNTKAILPINLYGQPYDYDELKTIADKYKLKIIEDACQAVGAAYGHKKAGTLGDLGCFSLYATKNIMSGEGGLITTNSEDYVAKMKAFRQHGMTAMNNTYEYTELGYNYRMTDLLAAIAVEQLKKADKFNEARQKNAKLLDDGLKDIAGLITPTTKAGRNHVYHQYTVRITEDFGHSRDEVAEYLKEKGIGVGIYYPKPLHAYRHIAKLGYKMGDFPGAEKAAAEVISLPVHPKVSKSDIAEIIKTFRELSV